MRRYVQTPGPIGEFSELPLWQRAETVDLVYVGYGLLVVALVLVSYLLGAFGWLPDDPQRMNVELINAAPLTSGHLLGTDFLGRDLQARLILGIQAYFLPGLLAITISVVGGSVLGVLAGYRGGWFDTIITYFDNLLDSFPRLVLILLVIATFKADIYYVMVVVGITGMPVIANLIAGKIAFLRQTNFIEAAHALGLPAHTVILKHILWFNCRAALVIQATLGMAEAILVETSLSYLGIVGESGSGKSVTALSAAGLVSAAPGVIGGRIELRSHRARRNLLDGLERYVRVKEHDGRIMAVEKDDRGWRRRAETLMEGVRGKEIAMIFQNPRSALNPYSTIGTQLVETIRLHTRFKGEGEGKEPPVHLLRPRR